MQIQILNVFLGKLILISFFLASCSDNKKSEKQEIKNYPATEVIDTLTRSNRTDVSISRTNSKLEEDSLAELLNKLKKKPVQKDFKLLGNLKTDILKYKSLVHEPMAYFVFTDKNNKEYDFLANNTKIELYRKSLNNNDEIEANKKYLDKNFRVVWRRLKILDKELSDSYEMIEEYDEIIYLKQIE